jgi:[NiFe] hydrogenase small subunit
MYPWIDELVLEILSIEYHETIMAAAGHQAEEQLKSAVKKYKGKFICVVEGAIATKFNGGYGKIGGRTFLEIAKEVTPQAAAVICIGACSSFGGVQAAAPNPGGYKSVGEALGIKTVNLPGCPPNPVNFVGTVVNYLLLGKLPALDQLGRPLFAYGKTIHDQCTRRAHFENDEFVEEFGSEEAAAGYCLYKMGCRGPETYNNCPINSTTVPAGRLRPVPPASVAVSRNSGINSPRFMRNFRIYQQYIKILLLKKGRRSYG